jgi:hypothetical protein
MVSTKQCDEKEQEDDSEDRVVGMVSIDVPRVLAEVGDGSTKPDLPGLGLRLIEEDPKNRCRRHPCGRPRAPAPEGARVPGPELRRRTFAQRTQQPQTIVATCLGSIGRAVRCWLGHTGQMTGPARKHVRRTDPPPRSQRLTGMACDCFFGPASMGVWSMGTPSPLLWHVSLVPFVETGQIHRGHGPSAFQMGRPRARGNSDAPLPLGIFGTFGSSNRAAAGPRWPYKSGRGSEHYACTSWRSNSYSRARGHAA